MGIAGGCGAHRPGVSLSAFAAFPTLKKRKRSSYIPLLGAPSAQPPTVRMDRVLVCSKPNALTAGRAQGRLERRGVLQLHEVPLVRPVPDVDFGLELVAALPAGLPRTRVSFIQVGGTQREPVVAHSAAVAGIGPFVVADEVAAAFRSGERAGLAAEAADTDRSGSTDTTGRRSLRHHKKGIIVGSPRRARGSHRSRSAVSRWLL
jgi:hypothetical protein